MDYKLIIPLASLAICVACYLDVRRERIALKKMNATRLLYVQPRLFGMSPRRMIVCLAVALALVSQL